MSFSKTNKKDIIDREINKNLNRFKDLLNRKLDEDIKRILEALLPVNKTCDKHIKGRETDYAAAADQKQLNIVHNNNTIGLDEPQRTDVPQELELSLEKFINVLKSDLEKIYGFCKVLKVGSYFSETSVGSGHDFDYLLQFEKLDAIQQPDLPHKVIVGSSEGKLPAKTWFEQFSQNITNICENISLPEGLTYAGFATPSFSGVRINQPAVTVLINWISNSTVSEFISVDIAPCVAIPADTIQELLLKNDFVFKDTLKDLTDCCHVVPLRNSSDEWTATTSYLETQLLQKHIKLQHVVRLTKAHGKRLFDQMKGNDFDTYVSNESGESNQNIDIKTLLEEKIKLWKTWNETITHSEGIPPVLIEKLKRLRLLIGKCLSEAHVLLPGEFVGDHYKCLSTPISFNSAALKYEVFNIFAHHESEGDVSLLNRLFAGIHTTNGQVRHTFLGYDIRLFKIALYAVPKMRDVLLNAYTHLAACELYVHHVHEAL